MKKSMLLIILLAIAMPELINAQGGAVLADADKSSLSWDTKKIDAGIIKQDSPLDLVFHFTNDGTKPVIINNVRTSCGCTAAKHNQAPILPGESSEIKVKYDTHRIGFFNKSISIQTSDSDQPTVLRITGTVE